jgi:hypothetical protein
MWGSGTVTLPDKPVTFSVEARDAANNRDTNFTGTVRLTSSDGRAVLPAEYTFVAGDRGLHAFEATFATAGAQRVFVADRDGRLAPVAGAWRVIGTADMRLRLVAAKEATAGKPFRVTVQVEDPFGTPLPFYTGTVHFTATGGGATLPPDYTFADEDASEHPFENGVTLRTPGEWTITATDTAARTVTGSATVTVKPATGSGGGRDP